MKKTLLVLSFAMCAMFAFAQTNRSVDRIAKGDNNQRIAAQSVLSQSPSNAAVNYKGSIFAKDDTVALFDFSMAVDDANANYSFGTMADHAQTDLGCTWTRWPSLDSNELKALGFADYYQLYYVYMNGIYTYGIPRLLDPNYCSSNTGFVMLDAYDPAGNSGVIDAYIEFDPVNTSDVEMFSVRLFQHYARFVDTCFIDYSVDGGNTWQSQQVNSDVQLGLDKASWGYAKFSMPSAAAAANSVKLRLRWKVVGNASGLGYWWMLDDVAVTKNVADRISSTTANWTAGGYQQIPQGFTTPIKWEATLTNEGMNDQTNTAFKLEHIYQGEAEDITTVNIGTLASEADTALTVTAAAGLPTDQLGDNFVTATVESDNLTLPYDTIYYRVNAGTTENPSMVWGRDHGVLNAKHSFLFGHDTSTYVSDGQTYHYIADESPYYLNAGYMATVAYETGANIPEGWVIRGIEFVVAVDSDVVNPTVPTKIEPVVMIDSTPGDDYIYFKHQTTGITEYTTTPADEYMTVEEMSYLGGHLTVDDAYRTIRINFPMQVALRPNQRYRAGYQLLEDAKFAVASSASYYRTIWVDSTQKFAASSFRNSAAEAKYYNNFTFNNVRLPNYYDVLTSDEADGYAWAGSNVSRYPMIHLLIGPASETKNIEVNCTFEDEQTELGGIYDINLNGICGSTIKVVEGESTAIYLIPEQTYTVATLNVDGTDINLAELETEPINDGEFTGYIYRFENVTADHVVNAEFSLGEGIDDVAARVKMNLQPNPATSKVKLNIQGVTGMVDCALLDMSGRVVTSRRINAEVENEIALSNLAKGAYFVRITNSDFTKVERLIVR